ncbi:MAG: tRNA uracil 4-sulfurtransferase ThiI [Candidatus Bathyarchaeia archaeon]|nr:MAG: tRNA 4-thiouridine(8) synthase ThiI [Candidatus Bathyarchaeota archaeon]
MFDCILVHYGELALKGLNRPYFEKKLIENMVKALAGQEYSDIKKLQGRILIELSEKSKVNEIVESLRRVFGIAWFAPCFITKADKESIKNGVHDKIELKNGEKVKVFTKRADKTLPFTSMDLNRELGEYIVKNFSVKISMKEPQKEIFVELVNGKAYIFSEKIRGLYGLPVGVSGKVLHLLSGGIDSPVAAWLLMKRGCEVDFLHFHAFQKFDEKRNAKILELAKTLKEYCFRAKVFFVPFYPFEAEAVEAPMRYRLILFRRFMVKVAERIARKHGVNALGSGENLAQVSSQTLENMAVIDSATSLPILRPLLTYEKNEIINLAKQIGTFEISVKPYKDCCSLFVAKHPVTKAKLEVVEAIEAKLHLEEAIDESVEKLEVIEA